MDQQFTTLMADVQAPAVGVAIVQGNQTLMCKAHGLADVEHNIPASKDSVFKLASVTKQFTAFAIMRLIELGLLSLTSPVKEVLPLVIDLHSGITVKHLLNHTSGIPNYTELPDRFKPFETIAATHAQMLSVFIDQPLLFEPGHGYEYSNSGYYLLGLIIEQVSGKTYDTYLKDEFFKPLGMENTSYADDRRIIQNRVKGYDTEHGNTPETGLLNCEFIHMNPPFAAGAICSTLEDMAIWSKAILQKRSSASSLLHSWEHQPSCSPVSKQTMDSVLKVT